MRYDPISTAFITASRWLVDVASSVARQFRAPRARVGMIHLPVPDLRPQAGEVWP